jgi:hypothetical protein
MSRSLIRSLLALVVVSSAAAGCSGAQPSSLSAPAVARALAVAPDFAGTIWVTTGGKAYSSSNGGHTWQYVLHSMDDAGVAFGTKYAYLIGGTDHSQIGDFGGVQTAPFRPTPVPFTSISSPYQKTDRFYALDLRGRLWISVRAGNGWARLRARGLPRTGVAVSAVRDLVTDPDIVYVATGPDGLWRSLDDGATFHKVPGVTDVVAVALTTDDQNRVLVGGPDGIWVSNDRGKSFSKVSSHPVAALALDPRNARLAYASSGHDLLRSVDGGSSWPH